MTAAQRTALRARQYTYYEVLAFAQFFTAHRTENSPEQLLAGFLKWKEIEGATSVRVERLMVIEQVCVDYYRLALQDVRGKRRYTELVRCRQVIAHLSVKYGSQNEVANALGNNRNNIQFGKTKCALLMETEAQLRKEVAEIEERLTEPFAAIAERERQAIADANKEGVENADKEVQQAQIPT
jgi:chromosomal replication initiation ATPase DnaA